jgi:hypothetical protein
VTFTDLVKREFDRRRANNPRYSLRAFARSLQIDHSTLSQIVRGRRRVTTRAIRSLGARLRMTPMQVAESCAIENDLAVLTVITGPAFRPNCRWIATLTGIPIDEVNVSLQRLLYNGVIVMHARNQWRIE